MINPTPALAAQSTPLATSPASAAQGTALTSDFETFLKMLTAQARYQDPLEPIDSTEYAAQLAQFSMVEQQVKGNDLLSLLTDRLALQNAAALSGWVGMEARAEAPAYFDGAPITLQPKVDKLGDRAVLVVRNEAGTQVQRLAMPVSDEPLGWTGLGEDGAYLPPGVYSFEVETFSNNDLLSTDPASVYARVEEAQIEDGSVTLVFAGGVRVGAGEVTGLRQPG